MAGNTSQFRGSRGPSNTASRDSRVGKGRQGYQLDTPGLGQDCELHHGDSVAQRAAHLATSQTIVTILPLDGTLNHRDDVHRDLVHTLASQERNMINPPLHSLIFSMDDHAVVCYTTFSLAALHSQMTQTASSQHYDPNSPPVPPLEDTRMSVDTGSGSLGPGSQSQQRCIIPGCQYLAYYNVAEDEQMEYCGHVHELCVLFYFLTRCISN